MKKSVIIAGAVAAIMAGTAVADTTVYGRARMGLVVSADNDNSVGLANGSSRFGFKGSEDLGNGMAAIYHFELGYNADNNAQGGLSNRIGMVGLKGDFGTIALGNQWTPIYTLVTSATDKFNLIYSSTEYKIDGRAGDAVAYINKFGSATVAAAFVMNDSGTESDLMDAYNIAASFPAGPVKIGVGVQHATDSGANGSAVSVAYKGDGFGAAFSYTDASEFGGDKATSLVGSFAVTSSANIVGRFSTFDAKTDNEVTLSYQNNMSKRTQVFVEASNNVVGAKYANGRTIIGIKHNF